MSGASKNNTARDTAAGSTQPGTATTNAAVEREAMFGVLPVMAKEKLYGFLDAFLVLSGYCIATWSYTQGSYLATLVGFKQLLIGAFLGAILMLVIYQLPVILSVRFGIDIWVWLRAAFGPVGILIMTVTIIIINYPWYAVCGDLFASSMINLLGFTGLHLPSPFHTLLAVLCVAGGTFIAYRGLSAITWTTRILVPLLFAVGAVVVIVGFTSVPFDYIMNFRPQRPEGEPNIIPYIMSVEANFAFVITLVGGMAEIPRVTKTERGGNARHHAGHDGGIQGGRRRNLHHSGLRQCPCTGSFHRTCSAVRLLLCGPARQRPRQAEEPRKVGHGGVSGGTGRRVGAEGVLRPLPAARQAHCSDRDVSCGFPLSFPESAVILNKISVKTFSV